MNHQTTQDIFACPVCNSTDFIQMICTPAHMHLSDAAFSFSCCDFCKSVFLNPRIKEDELSAYYPPSYLPYLGPAAWGKYHNVVARSQRNLDIKRATRCFDHFAPNQTISLLDVGCGRPTFLQVMDEKSSWSLTGVDFSPNGWGKVDPNQINLIEGEMHTVTFDQSFDLVTMWHYLEHDFTPQRTLQNVRQIMPKGGKLIIEVPDYLSWTARWQKEYWEGWHAPRHAVLYSQQGLTTLLSKHGFQVIDYYRYGTLDAFTLWWMGTMEKRGINWSQSMEREFIPLVWRMISSAPLFAFEKVLPLGIQTIIAEAI